MGAVPIPFDEGDVKVNGVTLNYARYGGLRGKPLLLIMGLAMQRTSWPDAWLNAFIDAGFAPITFDNRDTGLSTRFDHFGTPNAMSFVMQRMFGSGRLAYTLHDMAGDAEGLLDALKIPECAVLGLSMGGMIAQRLALRAPERVTRLHLAMTSSGYPWLPLPNWHVLRFMSQRINTAHGSEAAAVNYLVGLFQTIGSPDFPTDMHTLRMRAERSVARSLAGSGMARQFAAIQADSQRYRELPALKMPVQVIHGDRDPLLSIAHGKDLAARIPGSHFEAIAGMGHDLPDVLAKRFVELLSAA
jgi:pimeloyl-ACP methyl ester carboxylesterase